MAVKNAIDKLKLRLSEIALDELKLKLPAVSISTDHIRFSDNSVFVVSHPEIKIPFSELVKQAYLKQVSLSATGFTKRPESITTANQAEEIHSFIMLMAWPFPK